MTSRSEWKTRLGFLFAAVGSAVGLGNIWRFPYVVYKNGGGAFILVYIVVLLLVGIPMMIIEQGLGSRYHGSAPLTMARIHRKLEFFGWWPAVFLGMGIIFYYTVILSWCFNYLVFSAELAWGSDSSDFFMNAFLQISDGPFNWGALSVRILVGVIAVWGITWVIVCNGIKKGIELANRFFIPLLALCMVVLVMWAFTLDGAMQGLRVFATPDFAMVLSLRVWIDAFVQVFFSIGIGMGIMITYASYLPSTSPINNNSAIVCVMDMIFAIFAGIVVFATLGYMSHVSGLPMTEVVRGGPELVFVTYPEIINSLPVGGAVFGVLFFLALIFAGLSSVISIIEPIISGLVDKYGMSRKVSISCFATIGIGGGVLFSFGSGLYWVDIVDHFIGHYGLIMIACVEVLIVGWLIRTDTFMEEVNRYSSFSAGQGWRWIVKYVLPIVFVSFLALEAWRDMIGGNYGGYTLHDNLILGFGWLVVTGLIAMMLTQTRGRAGWLTQD